MSIPLPSLQRIIGQLDPFKPLEADSDLYVELDDGEGARCERSCANQLYRTISLNTNPTYQLFSGFPGSGKTTELKRLAARLERDKQVSTKVIYIDFGDYIDIHRPVEIADILRTLAYCMDEAASKAEGSPSTRPSYLQRFWDYIATTDVNLKEMGFEAYGASLMLELKQNPDFAERIAKTIQGRFQQFAKMAHDMMSESVARLAAAPGVVASRVVVICDGLEKLTSLGEGVRAKVELAVEQLFVGHQDLLRLPCHAIFTFPLWLRFLTPLLGAAYGNEPLVLPMVKIADESNKPCDSGLAKLEELVRRRIGSEFPEVFGPNGSAILRSLLNASGGYPRDLLRMVRWLVMNADLPITTKDCETVINNVASAYSDTILSTYLDVLAAVGTTHNLPRESESQRALFGHLFQHWLILAYRNGHEWYDLHPLVRRDRLVQQRLTGG